MNWDKKIYPKDVWKWIKDHLPYWPWDITGGVKHTFKRYMKGIKAHKGGFTPRREVSEVDRAYFDTGQWDMSSERLDYLDKHDKWKIDAYDLAERTGLWDVDMADDIIDGNPLLKIERERK